MSNQEWSRRNFLSFSSTLLAGSLVGQKTLASDWAGKKIKAHFRHTQEDWPISYAYQANSTDFNGDEIDRPHDILWDPQGYLARKGGRPAVSEYKDVVVVGGGLSGLSSAYFLRDRNTVLLEQASQFGGNARGENYNGSTYSTGSAYIVRPAPGSYLHQLLSELGLLEQLVDDGHTTVSYQSRLWAPFWEAATAPEARDSFFRFTQRLRQLEDVDIYAQYDHLSFAQWLQIEFPDLHVHLVEYIQLYCWSSFVGSMDELSAAQVLSYLMSEQSGIASLPGGNAAIAQAMAVQVRQSLGHTALRAGAFVLDVQMMSNGQVEVCYEDAQGVIQNISAKKVIIACPKFVAKRILPQLPPAQYQAMNNINYRGYVVANLILRNRYQAPSFELYSLKGYVPEAPRALRPPTRPYTDVCFAGWADRNSTGPSVISIYKALPFDGARQFLFSPMAHSKNRQQILDGVPELLQTLQIPESEIEGVRMTRWGHSLPLAAVNAVQSGLAELASQPMDSSIFFANQDNWMSPCFESGLNAAVDACTEIRKLI